MTLFFQNHQIEIFRQRHLGNNRYALSATYTSYDVDLQPASSTRTEEVQGRFGAVYTAFVEANIDIKEADQVHITSGIFAGKVFSVKGVQHWEGAGLLDHIELTLIAQDG